jgi:hypothetical protein
VPSGRSTASSTTILPFSACRRRVAQVRRCFEKVGADVALRRRCVSPDEGG